ncbi:MAG: molybdate ABC transporter substrate-binding protein [Rickettsiales bacterium]|nr:molybdate ABC transporter substrate-binding protein [Rickettsiales bacterium]
MTKTTIFLWFLFVLQGLMNPAFAKNVPTVVPMGINIMADESLIVPITLIARAYATEYQIPVSAQFAASNLQIKQLEEGAEANVLIAAKAIWLRQLETMGLIDVYSRTPVARNQLALTTLRHFVPSPPLRLSQGLTTSALTPAGFTADDVSLALGDPEFTAEGTYALDAFSHLKLESELEPHFVFIRDMRALADSLNSPGAYGVVFQTDVQLRPSLGTVDIFPPASHVPIVYEAVTIAGENMAGGRHFVDYLTSDKARTIFQRFGFLPPA